MTLLTEGLIAALLILGGSFGLIGSYGLLKLKQPMQRLHAPTKASTLGVGATLIASALGIASAGQGFAWQEILISAFLFLTAPLSALYLAKTHLLRGLQQSELPPSASGAPWATLAPERSSEFPTDI